MENKFIKFLCIVVSLLCCGCSVIKNSKDNIIEKIVSYDNKLNGKFLEYIYDKYGMEL